MALTVSTNALDDALARYDSYQRDSARVQRLRQVDRFFVAPVRTAVQALQAVGIGASPATITDDVFDPRDANGNRLTTPVRTQPVRNLMCTAYAVAAMMETWWCRQQGSSTGVPFISVTKLFTNSSSVADTAAKAGVAVLDEDYPEGQDPPAPEAPHRWKLDWRSFKQEEDNRPLLMCQALVSDGPLAINIRLFDDFLTFKDPTDSIVYSPGPAAVPLVDAHAVCVIGFDQLRRAWIVKNSDAGWGYNGFGRIGWGDRHVHPEHIVVGARRVVHPVP